jgi:single-strand DNA-binding protein
MNKVILSGRISNDIVFRNTGKTDGVLFSIAVQRNFKNPEGKYDCDFVNCKAFGNTADFINNYFKKGDAIELEGRLDVSMYEKDGKNVYSTSVLVNSVEFAKGNKKDENQAENGQKSDTSQEEEFEFPF